VERAGNSEVLEYLDHSLHDAIQAGLARKYLKRSGRNQFDYRVGGGLE